MLSSKLETGTAFWNSIRLYSPLSQGEAVWSLYLVTLSIKSEHFALRPKLPHLKTGCLSCTRGWREANNRRDHWACSDPKEHVRGAWCVCSSEPAGYWDSINRAFHSAKDTQWCIRNNKPNTLNTEQNNSKYPSNHYLYTGHKLPFKGLRLVRFILGQNKKKLFSEKP